LAALDPATWKDVVEDTQDVVFIEDDDKLHCVEKERAEAKFPGRESKSIVFLMQRLAIDYLLPV